MITGRLSGHQLVGLLKEYDTPYIIVEGIWRPDRESGILQRIGRGGKWISASQGSRRFMARDVYSYVNTLQVICNVVCISTSNKWETAQWLDSSYRWWQKSWDRHKSHLQWHRGPEGPTLAKPSLVARIAAQFEGIGWSKATEIGLAFPDLWSFMGAEASEFEKIPGIGKPTAESIVKQRDGEGT